MNKNLHAAGNDCALMCHRYQQGNPDTLAASLQFLASSPNQLKWGRGIFP